MPAEPYPGPAELPANAPAPAGRAEPCHGSSPAQHRPGAGGASRATHRRRCGAPSRAAGPGAERCAGAEGPPPPRCPSSALATGRAAGRWSRPRGGLGGAVGHGPGPARPCPRCPEVEMQKSRLSRRDVDFLVVVFFLALLFPSQRRSERLGASAARSAGGRESVPGHRDPLGFRAGLEVPRSEEWVSGREPQKGSSAVKRGGAPVRSHLPPPRLPY